MVRNVLGSVIAAIGAAGAVWSPFCAWYNGRRGRTYRLSDLFSPSGVEAHGAALLTSLFLPFLVAAALTLLGVVLLAVPSSKQWGRLLVAVAGVLVLGFTVLWMVREGQAQQSLTVNSDGTGLGLGVARAVAGGLLLILAALIMRGRPGRGRHARGHPSRPTPTERP